MNKWLMRFLIWLNARFEIVAEDPTDPSEYEPYSDKRTDFLARSKR